MLTLLVCSAIALGACGGDDDSGDSSRDAGTAGDDEPLAVAGRVFVSTAVTGHELVPGTEIVLTFGDDGSLGAHAGCNQLAGGYEIDGDTLVTGQMATTEMACDADRMAQDDWLLALLSGRPTLALDGDALVLTSGDVSVELLDREVARPDLPLTGRRWVVDTVVEGGPDGTAATIPPGTEGWLEFGDSEVRGFDTCNGFSGAVEIAGGTLTFGPLRSTRVGCDDLGLVQVLVGEVAYSIDADRLTLTNADGRGFSLVAS